MSNHTEYKIYKERANGRWEYWTYSDGSKIIVSEAFAKHEVSRGLACVVTGKV